MDFSSLWTIPDDPQQQRNAVITTFLGGLLAFSVFWLFGFRSVVKTKELSVHIRSMGVGIKRVSRTIRELKRKTFHLLGLLIPCIYFFGLKYAPDLITRRTATVIVGTITSIYWFLELLRLLSASFRAAFRSTLSFLLRSSEENKITGMGYYTLGCFLCIAMFPPLIALASMLYLVLGDLSAAIIGISFGNTKINNKSFEGFCACFVTCFIIGTALFWKLPLFEVLAWNGALVASIVELFSPFQVDDNLSIPILSALTLQLTVWRLSGCISSGEYTLQP